MVSGKQHGGFYKGEENFVPLKFSPTYPGIFFKMDFAPWHLGLRRLLWGRFCGQLHSMIWIV